MAVASDREGDRPGLLRLHRGPAPRRRTDAGAGGGRGADPGARGVGAPRRVARRDRPARGAPPDGLRGPSPEGPDSRHRRRRRGRAGRGRRHPLRSPATRCSARPCAACSGATAAPTPSTSPRPRKALRSSRRTSPSRRRAAVPTAGLITTAEPAAAARERRRPCPGQRRGRRSGRHRHPARQGLGRPRHRRRRARASTRSCASWVPTGSSTTPARTTRAAASSGTWSSTYPATTPSRTIAGHSSRTAPTSSSVTTGSGRQVITGWATSRSCSG